MMVPGTELIFKSIVGAMVGYITWKLRMIENKADEAISRRDAIELIKDKMEPIHVMIHELHLTTQRIESKLDRSIERDLKP